MKATVLLKALYFIFSLNSLHSSDVYRHESGRCCTLSCFLKFFIISALQVFLLYYYFVQCVYFHFNPGWNKHRDRQAIRWANIGQQAVVQGSWLWIQYCYRDSTSFKWKGNKNLFQTESTEVGIMKIRAKIGQLLSIYSKKGSGQITRLLNLVPPLSRDPTVKPFPCTPAACP